MWVGDLFNARRRRVGTSDVSMRVPSFRSIARDRNTDADRFEKLRKVAAATLNNVQSELAGLQRRHAVANERANMLMGTDVFEPREEADEILLTKVENELMRASQRIHSLGVQVETLQRVTALLDELP
jgi:hypothetical protein